MRTRLMIVVLGVALGMTVKWLSSGWTGSPPSPAAPQAIETQTSPAAISAEQLGRRD